MANDNKAGSAERLIVLGKVGAPWGVRGWVKLTSFTEPREALLDYRECFMRRSGEWIAASLEASHPQGKSLVGKLAGIDDRDAALEWRGAEIGFPREQMPSPGDGHYYWADLEGLEVRHRDGRELGRVAYLLATGEHDVLVVQGEREVLIPFVMDRVILSVDLTAGVIDVDWEWD
ncbi:MAG: 16S rRNA processing protein RimM [Woeseia sp.]|nr:16S rRNA processing protein RimM [Woeseia sp.]